MGTKTFESIPYDILIEIFQYLTLEDLVTSVQYVCKNWFDIIQDSVLWKDVTFKPPLGMKTNTVKLLLRKTPFLTSFEFGVGLKRDDIVDALCEYNKCITSLSFGCSSVPHLTMQKLLTNLPDLECIQLPYSDCVNNIHTLAKFPKLKEIKCSHVFQSNILLRSENQNFSESDWPSLTSLSIASEHVDSKFQNCFEFLEKQLLTLQIQAVRSPSALLRIKNCVRLESLKLNFLSRQLLDVTLEEIFIGLKNLKKLQFLSLRSFVHADANVLCNIFDKTIFPDLREINLSRCLNFSARAAKSIANSCPQLEVLCFHGCIALDDSCLQELSRCSRLCVLDVAGCRSITEKGLSYLKNCIRLCELNLNWLGVISLPMLDEISQMKSLSILHMDQTELNGNHLVNAARCMPKLTKLSVYNTIGVDGHLLEKSLPRCRVKYIKHTLHGVIQEKANVLRSLELNGVSNDMLVSVMKCKNLEELTINFLMRPCFPFCNFIPTLQTFEKLQTLSLKCFVATEVGLLCQLFSKEFTALRELNFECCLSVGEHLAEVIAMFQPRLEKLQMKGCVALNDEGFANIVGMKNLNTLDVSGCQGLTSRGLIQLQACEGLRELNVCGMASGAITEEVLFSVLSLKVLSTVYFDNTEGVKTFMEMNNWCSCEIVNSGREARFAPCV